LPTQLGRAEAESAAGSPLMLYDGAMAADHPDGRLDGGAQDLLDALRRIRSGS
jgi:hypothetical protein